MSAFTAPPSIADLRARKPEVLTALVNEHFSARDKYDLVYNLWRVAYADGSLDKHEEALIRHIAELIHLPHAGFVQARNQARAALASPISGDPGGSEAWGNSP